MKEGGNEVCVLCISGLQHFFYLSMFSLISSHNGTHRQRVSERESTIDVFAGESRKRETRGKGRKNSGKTFLLLISFSETFLSHTQLFF
jgi:hypothetical protein